MAAGNKSKLTDSQHDLCYEIQFALIRAIINIDHEKMWEHISKVIEGQRGEHSEEDNRNCYSCPCCSCVKEGNL